MAKKKKKGSRLWTILIILVVIIGGVFVFTQLNKGDDTVKVTTSKAIKKTIVQTVSAIGQIQPETEVKISSETSGEIIYLGVQEGDTAAKNKLLVRIKPDIFESQLEQFAASVEAGKMDVKFSKAELERTEQELERIENLYKKEFASLQEFQNAKIAYDKAMANYQSSLNRLEQVEASLREVKRNAERTTIYSPIEGIVTKLEVEEGEKVVGTAQMQGTEMMRIADLDIMNAVVEVDENDIVLVEVGDTANVEIDAFPDKLFKGTVIEIGHSANVSGLGSQEQVTNFNVKIRLLDKEAKLRPGMSCNADIMTETRNNVVAVPLPAVTVRTDVPFDKNPDVNENARSLRQEDDEDGIKKVNRPPSVVFLYKNGKAELQKVETGISDNGFIEIREGLEDGQEVISGSFLAVSRTLKDGMQVQIDTLSNKFKRN
jgi:HlyD family secretion protein